MREIKFRAWDTFNKRMVYDPYYFRNNLDKELSFEPEWQVPYQFAEQWQDVDDGIWRPCQLMQYTGLKDKNGKEIYEGDFIQNVADDGRRLSVFEIRWQQSSCGFVKEREDGHTFTLEISKYFEVVGNKFENPEFFPTVN